MSLRSLLIYLLSISCNCSFGQNVVKGTVKDVSGETLIGATISVKGTQEAAVTDVNGNFELKTTKIFPLKLIITFVGYIAAEVEVVAAERNIEITLRKNEVLLKGATVTGSRISEKQKQSPLTVESMDYIAIKESPSISFYDGLGQLKGVDLTSASIGFKIINTRGFNSTSPVRSLQIIDGIDNASPGLNFSLGNFVGASELDVNKVDLVVGASSAYYGPNAFNGVISISTRSPFIKPGLEFCVKTGDRDLNEFALRYAVSIKNKKDRDFIGAKFNIYKLGVRDWEANNISATPQSRSNVMNPGGYDAVNIYGDEFQNGYDLSKNAKDYPGLMVIARKGYAEKDLVDYDTKNLKLGAALHYKPIEKIEIIGASNYGNGTTVYQGDNRYCLKDIRFWQHRFEVRQQGKWFVRAYATQEDAGKSYDAFFTALLLQRAAKSDGDWYQDYIDYWYSKAKTKMYSLPGYPKAPVYNPQDTNGYAAAYLNYIYSINPFLLANYYDTLLLYHNNAQTFATGVGNPLNENLPYFAPGTYEFDTTFAGITSRKTFKEGGSRFYDKSALYHVHAEYKYTFYKNYDITLGGNYRKYMPKSDGTIFSDTSYYTTDSVFYDSSKDSLLRVDSVFHKTKIVNEEFGLYLGTEARLFNDKIKLCLTTRLDKNQNFDYLISPAASIVYMPFANHIIRTSFSSAIRNPTLTDQYLYYQVGRAILVGNKDGYNDLVTIPSLINFYDLNKQFDTLEFFSVKPVRPEEVKTIEAGYRATLFKRLYIDVSAYYSWYKYFIGYKIGADVDTFSFTVPIFIPPFYQTINDLRFNNVVRVATNSEDEVTTQGISAGLNYYLGKYFAITTNYSYNFLDRHGSKDPLIPAYNTPKHKFNVCFNGRDIKSFGFSINHKWVDGFYYEGSPQFTGPIKTYSLTDVQINYRFAKNYLTAKLGSSNVLNNLHYEVYGGPLVGRMFFLSLLFEFPQGSN